ncbi:MAG: roadblock/LC7 domain-containing protein [Methanoregula sp.]|jgi:predicted regulator of Ras-like GTPase activity (Roadblock/LC7/MglB family)|uniref:roadblock/LC7 domain-containing protein n=1 Tax=Methanoregula sp. TaxID=2052170 RepID=UPI003D0BDB1D
MKLPAGTAGDVVINSQKEGMLQYLMAFKGAIMIDSGSGRGFILTRNGELIAAYFKDKHGVYRGTSALQNLMAAPGSDTGLQQQNFIMRVYSDEDFAEALELCTNGGVLIESVLLGDNAVPAPAKTPESPRHTSTLLDESTLTKIISQPGVVAVSAFYEGFPVQSLGRADFVHVAARAEDLLRAGTKIAQDMNFGQPDQLILETTENKFIIAPCGDLFLCIITSADAQLGLMRVLLKSIQTEVEGEA